jgi:hypothetical protein
MPRTYKTSWLLWGVFGLLILASVLCLLHGFAVAGLTPMMVYDSSESVPKLSDKDISALCHSVSRYTGRVLRYSSIVVVAWALFAGLVLFSRRPRPELDANKNNIS